MMKEPWNFGYESHRTRNLLTACTVWENHS